jgi:hypothetical protein
MSGQIHLHFYKYFALYRCKQMQAIDVTGMSQKEMSKVGHESMDVEIHDGIARPIKKRERRPVDVRGTKKNMRLKELYGDHIFNKYGQLNYAHYDPVKILAKLNRQDRHAQQWTIKAMGPKLAKVLLEEVLPGSDLKGKTKDRLDRLLRKSLERKSTKPVAIKRTKKPATKKSKKAAVASTDVPIQPI